MVFYVIPFFSSFFFFMEQILRKQISGEEAREKYADDSKTMTIIPILIESLVRKDTIPFLRNTTVGGMEIFAIYAKLYA